MKYKIFNQAFTIVELIVVITILAILGTIGFMSFSSHIVGTRDTNRQEQLFGIHQGLETYSAQNTLPIPDNYVEVRASGTVIGYQGYVGKNVLGQIGYGKGGKDPKDDQYLTYYLTKSKKHFQILGFLEDKTSLQVYKDKILGQTYAVDYSRRYPTVIGKKLGILTESGTNSPIQEVSSIVSSGYLDVVLTLSSYTSHFTDQDSVSGTGLVLAFLKDGGGKSCNDILIKDPTRKKKDGSYYINPNGTGSFQVYCDMTTDEGGWTLIYSSKNDASPLAESSYVALRTNNYLSASKIKLIANVSNSIYIKDDTGGYVKTVSGDLRPIKRLRNGLSPQGGYGLGVDNTVSWSGNKISNLSWGWSNQTCYDQVNVLALPGIYYACNNTNGAHIFDIATSKGWAQVSSLNLDVMIK